MRTDSPLAPGRIVRAPFFWTGFVLAIPNFAIALRDGHVALRFRILQLVFALALVAIPLAIPFRSKWLLWAALPLMTIVPFETFQILAMGFPSSMGMIGTTLDTTPREAGEILGKAGLFVFLALCVPIGHAILVFKAGGSERTRRRGGLFSVPVVLAAAGLGAEAWHIHSLPIERSWKVVTATREIRQTFPLGFCWKLADALSQKVDLARRDSRIRDFRWNPSAIRPLPAREVLVLVVGESSRAGNWQILGYGRPTTPLLRSDTSSIVFGNATSGANLTTTSLPQFLSLAGPDDDSIFQASSSILSCLREAGFKTWWLSAQSRFGMGDDNPAKIGKEADLWRFLSEDWQHQDGQDDSRLLPLLDSALADPAPRKFVVVHTLGSHFDYRKRYPDRFDTFRTAAGEYPGLASYDNSIRFTDWFLGEVRRRLGGVDAPTALVYLSDHGECLGEDGGRHNHGSPDPIRAEIEIPLVFWLSEGFRAQAAQAGQNLRANRNRKVSTSDLPPTLLAMAGLRSDRLDSTRNLAGSGFLEHPRRVRTPTDAVVDADTLRFSSFVQPPKPVAGSAPPISVP